MYIGMTKQSLERRFLNGRGYKHSSHFDAAIQKYGWDNFEHTVIAKDLSEDEAKELEIKLIQEYQTRDKRFGYNISPGGDWHCYSEEAKERLSKLFSGAGNPNYGKSPTPEQRAERSRKYSGVNAPSYGRETPIETCNKISAALIGKPCPNERKEQITNTLKQYYLDNPVPKGFGRPPKKIVCIETGIIYDSIAEAARQLGINNKQGISQVAKGIKRTCGGYHWKYYESSVS